MGLPLSGRVVLHPVPPSGRLKRVSCFVEIQGQLCEVQDAHRGKDGEGRVGIKMTIGCGRMAGENRMRMRVRPGRAEFFMSLVP